MSKHLKDAGNSLRHHLPQDQLLQLIDDTCYLESTGRADGYRQVQAALLSMASVRPPAADVRCALRANDPQTNKARRERIIPQRTYDVTDEIILWHMDSKTLADTIFKYACLHL